MTNSVKMTNEMSNKAAQLLSQVTLANIKFQLYIEGCKDGLELEGDWNFDTATLTFSKMPNQEKKPPEAKSEKEN